MIDYLDEQQNRAFEKLANAPGDSFVLWWKMGTGKTRIALAAFMESDFKHCVVVTRRVAFDSWIDEVEICNLPITIFENNYQMVNCRKLALKKDKMMLLVSAGDLKSIPVNFPYGQMIVVDELYLFSNPKSDRSKKLQKMTLLCSSRIGLSGTIMPARDNLAIYGQLKALFGHHSLARTSTEFRSKFQDCSKGRFGRVYLNKPGSDVEIARLLASSTDTYFPDSRPTRTQHVKVNKTQEQAKAIKNLQELYEHDGKEYKYALQIVHVVNGISNGWLMPESGILEHYKSAKIDMLLSMVDDLVAAGDRVVVWCSYHNDIARIAAELKHEFLQFSGSVPFDEERWNTGKVRVVLATEAMGASVNYFKHVKYAIYFSINYRLLDLQQSMGRHERKGSEHDGAHYYFLQTRGTIDAETYRLVTKSQKSEQDMMEILAKQVYDL